MDDLPQFGDSEAGATPTNEVDTALVLDTDSNEPSESINLQSTSVQPSNSEEVYFLFVLCMLVSQNPKLISLSQYWHCVCSIRGLSITYHTELVA